MTTAAIIGLIALAGVAVKGTYDVASRAYRRNEADNTKTQLQNYAGATSTKEFNAYLRDAMALGYIDGNTNKNALAAYNKLRANNYDTSSLTKAESKAVTSLYNQLYQNDSNFKSLWDKQYSDMSDTDKLKFLEGASTAGASIPAPAYLDTSFETYQKEVAPLKLYSNKELADLYNLDFDYENILKDYEAGAQAKVNLADYLSAQEANAAERDNVTNTTSYLDAIRNNKNQAVINGMTTGARAAGELLANREAIQNKVNANAESATNRFQTENEALLNSAQSTINATKMYNGLAKNLSGMSSTLYGNDVARKGQDLLSNANFLSADENLRANRQAQNNLMSAIQANVSAQNRAQNSGVNSVDWLFKNVYLPAADNNVTQALSDFIGTQYSQQTGYSDPMSKWGGLSK